MFPEKMAGYIVRDFNNDWLKIVRDEWSGLNRFPRQLYSTRDPIILLERMIHSCIENDDLDTFYTCILILRDQIEEISEEDDGPIIDRYLSYKFKNLIQTIYNHRAFFALDFLCSIISEITAPSDKYLKNCKISSFETPPGCEFLKMVVEKSLKFHEYDIACKAIYLINKRAIQTINALPEYEKLSLINKDNQNENISTIDMEIFFNNDNRLINYTFGFIVYLGHIGKLALELNLPEISKEVCRCFFIQISTIISNIIIEPYQYYLVSKIFENIKILVNYACNKNIDNSIDLNWVLYFNNKVPTKSVAKLIIENFSFIVMELCKIGSLDIVGITFFAQSSIDIASSYPELSLSIISFFGKVISNLTKQNEKYKEITKVSIVNDIMERIDQLERIGLRSENKDIIQKSVKTIKRKTSIFLKNKKTIPCDNE